MIEPHRLGAKEAAALIQLGLQVIGRINHDARTLACAQGIDSRLKEVQS